MKGFGVSREEKRGVSRKKGTRHGREDRKKNLRRRKEKNKPLLPAIVQLELGICEELVPVEEQREGLEVDVAGLVVLFVR